MKQNINEIKRMQRIAGLITENEYKYMNNDELLNVLSQIYDAYNNEDFAESQPVFLEAAKHIKMAIDLIKKRTGE